MIISVTKESINGVAFSLVCNCASMVIDSKIVSRLSKSQAIRYTATQHKCKFVLLTHCKDGDIYDFAPKSGVSFARQIEHFIETHADGAQLNAELLLLLIPLDKKIYFADIEKGLVSNERTLVISAAKKEIEEAQSSAVKIFLVDGGTSQEELNADNLTPVASFVISEKGIRNKARFYFEPLLKLMTFRWRLFHPAQAILFVVVLLVVAGGIYSSVAVVGESKERSFIAERIVLEKERGERLLRELRIKKNTADYSAAASLRSFLDYYQTVHLLSGSGLTQMTWNYSQNNMTEINVTGHTKHYPKLVVSLGASDQWDLQLNGSDWTLTSRHKTNYDRRQIDVDVDAKIMRPLFIRLQSATAGTVEFKNMRREDGYELVDLSVGMLYGISAITDAVVTLIDNNPITLESVVCEFGDWALRGCQAELHAKYRSVL